MRVPKTSDEGLDSELWSNGARCLDLIEKGGDPNYALPKYIDGIAAGWVTLIKNGSWKKFIPCKHNPQHFRYESLRGSEGVAEYENFDKFLQANWPFGLGDDAKRTKFKAMVSRFSPEYQERINLALVEAEIKPISEVRSEAGAKGNNVRWKGESHFDLDQNAIKPKYNTGTSIAYQMQLLARSGRKDLIDMVTNGEMPLKNALEQAGLKKERHQLNLTPGTPPQRLLAWLMAHYDKDALESLCKDVCEVLCDDCDDEHDDIDEVPPAPARQRIRTPKPAALGEPPQPASLIGPPYDGSPVWCGHDIDSELIAWATAYGETGRPWKRVVDSRLGRDLSKAAGGSANSPAFDPYRQAYNEALQRFYGGLPS